MSAHETLQQELDETRKKLQEYADTVVSLHGELTRRTLRDGICKSCKRNFPANLVLSQATEAAVGASSLVKRIPVRTNPTFSWRRLLKVHAPDHIPSSSGLPTSMASIGDVTQTLSPSPSPVLATIPTNGALASTSEPLTTTTSRKTIAPKTVPIDPRWSAQRAAAANDALNVTFVRAFSHESHVRSVWFSADGKYLAAALAEGEYASQYSSMDTPGIYCLCLSPNGRYLVAGDGAGRIMVWDIPNKRIRNIFGGHHRPVESVNFSPNGRFVVSASWDSTVRIWSMRDGSTRVFKVGGYTFWSVRFSPNGQFVAAGNSAGIIRTWDVRTGQLVTKWTGHQSSVRAVVFIPDGRGLVTGSYGGVVKCWDIGSLGTVQFGGEPEVTILGHAGPVYAVAVSPDAQWIASGLSDKRTAIYDTHGGGRQFTLIGHMGAVSSVDFSPAGSYLAVGSYDRHVSLWRYTGT